MLNRQCKHDVELWQIIGENSAALSSASGLPQKIHND
jgi:hypothetical protein